MTLNFSTRDVMYDDTLNVPAMTAHYVVWTQPCAFCGQRRYGRLEVPYNTRLELMQYPRRFCIAVQCPHDGAIQIAEAKVRQTFWRLRQDEALAEPWIDWGNVDLLSENEVHLRQQTDREEQR